MNKAVATNKIQKDDFNRIIFIPGITHLKKASTILKESLKNKFPDKEIIFLDDIFYIYTEKKKVELITKQALDILKDNKKTIIIAHSYGGVLAKKVIEKNRKEKRENIVSLITLASPHTYNLFGLKKAKEKIKAKENVKIKTFTFGGYFDLTVPFTKTKLKNSFHKNLKASHMAFLLSKKIINQVLEIFE